MVASVATSIRSSKKRVDGYRSLRLRRYSWEGRLFWANKRFIGGV